MWDRATGEPIHHAIVWQDRRTAAACDELKEAGHADRIRTNDRPGGGRLLLGHQAGVAAGPRRRRPRRAPSAATSRSARWTPGWCWQLSGGRAHVTEPSNACRTMLWDVRRDRWSTEMQELLDVPAALLPEARDSSGDIAHTDPGAFLGIDAPITGIGGDQQSALFGQGCWTPGTSKNTYGTGSFLLLNTGDFAAQSEHGLLTSVGLAHQRRDHLRPGGRDLRDRRGGPVAARRPGHHRQRRRDRGAGSRAARRQRGRLPGARPSSASGPRTGTPTPAARWSA